MCSVKSLYNITMELVLNYISCVENFIAFPALIGEEIFKRYVHRFKVEDNSLSVDILKKFVDAYENLILGRLNLSHQLLILNEYFQPIITISTFITELCVCDCFLGKNHEIYRYILHFENLRTLCLRNNSMNDSAMRLLTLRTRMYGNGGKDIENLDLSGNCLTDGMITWLSAFPSLDYLNLTGSKISKKGLQILEKQFHLKQICNDGDHKEIVTEGWASLLLDKWIKDYEMKRKKKTPKISFKKNISLISNYQVNVESISSPVFQKILLKNRTEHLVLPAKKRKFTISLDEEDIFSQYT